MRTLYLRPRLAKTLPRSCCVLNVSALLKELILHACMLAALNRKNERQRHLIALILDQLETIQTVSLQLPNPSDPRALRVAGVLLANPGDQRTLTQICKEIGAGKRTIERRFQDETGMTFGKWRQQLRLMQAMRLLAEGSKVTHAAMEAGYSTPSAFISMFSKAGELLRRAASARPRRIKKDLRVYAEKPEKAALENLAGIDFSA